MLYLSLPEVRLGYSRIGSRKGWQMKKKILVFIILVLLFGCIPRKRLLETADRNGTKVRLE